MRRRRAYKFTDKQHSKRGIRSSIAGAIALCSTGIALYNAYLAKGNGGNFLALFGTIAIVSCVYGSFVGSKSFREEECYYFFSRLGTGMNLVLVIFWVAVFGVGILI